jgi:nucleoside-diphosphate-sugar epimerase
MPGSNTRAIAGESTLRRRKLAHILVTGAAGFIGRALCREFARRGHRVRGAVRGAAAPIPGVELRAVGDIGRHTDWARHLAAVDVVVHLATSAHRPVNPVAAAAEADGVAALVWAASAGAIRRLVHVSSIRAMGEATPEGTRFHAGDPPAPKDGYGRAKLELERAAAAAARTAGLDLVVVRPPLVYGPGVKGNFRALITLADSGLPLPFAALRNRRSLIYLDNLVALIVLAAIHPGSGGRVLLARDALDLSVREVVAALALGLGRRVRQFPLPPALFAGIGLVPAVGPALRRLALPLLVDDSDTRRMLGWTPTISPEEGLVATARAYARR